MAPLLLALLALAWPAEPQAEAPQLSTGLSELRTYRDQRLVRFGYTQLHLTDAQVPGAPHGWTTAQLSFHWAVSDGAGRVLTPEEFAVSVGDVQTLDLIRRRRRHWSRLGGGLTALGLGVMGAAWAYDVQHPSLWRNGVTTAGTAGGLVILGTGLMGIFIQANRRKRMGVWYLPERVDGLIAGHNDALRVRLGLSEAEVREIELAAGMTFRQAEPGLERVLDEYEKRKAEGL